MEHVQDVAGTARRLLSLPPSCGPVRLVAVDGHAGSGKSTFAGRLADALGSAAVVHLDDLASHQALFAWTDRLGAQVVRPLSRGATARFEVYDWERRAFTGTARVEPAEVVIVEGVGAGRSALRPLLACLLWMDVPEEEAWARGRRRDGAALADFWEGWIRAERRHFGNDPSYPHAHCLVREHLDGHQVRPGPAGWCGTRRSITLGEAAEVAAGGWRAAPPGRA